MGGARSISEDSVFKPGEKEGGLDAIKQTAVSMEQVNQQFRVRVARAERPLNLSLGRNKMLQMCFQTLRIWGCWGHFGLNPSHVE